MDSGAWMVSSSTAGQQASCGVEGDVEEGGGGEDGGAVDGVVGEPGVGGGGEGAGEDGLVGAGDVGGCGEDGVAGAGWLPFGGRLEPVVVVLEGVGGEAEAAGGWGVGGPAGGDAVGVEAGEGGGEGGGGVVAGAGGGEGEGVGEGRRARAVRVASGPISRKAVARVAVRASAKRTGRRAWAVQ